MTRRQRRRGAAARGWQVAGLGLGLLPVLLAARGVLAQEAAELPAPVTQALSLDDAVALALTGNPELAAIREELPAAVARLEMARSEGRLVASLNTFLSSGTMGNILGGPETVRPQMLMNEPDTPRADQNLMLSYPIYTGGRVGQQIEAGRARVRSSQAEIDRMVLEVAYEARKAYWQVLLSRETQRVQEENLAKQRERLRVDQAFLDAGKVARYVVDWDKAEVAAAEQEVTNAIRDVATALLDLRLVLGLPSTAPLELTERLGYDPAAAEVNEAVLVGEALRKHPRARGLQADLEAAKREVRARQAAFRMQVEGMAILEAEKVPGNARSGYTVGVVGSVPVLDGGSRRAAVREAQAMVRKTERETAALALELERDVRTALLDLRAANQNVRTAMEGVAAAEENYRVALVRYQAEKSKGLEPISALALLVGARTSLAQALFEYNVALDAVQRSAGSLPVAKPKDGS